MNKKTLISRIKELNRPVFSTRELSAVSGKSQSAVSQGLAFLEKQGLVIRIAHGVWGQGNIPPSPYATIAHILPKQRAYVSFTSALHLHGIIEQIPQVVTLASVSHTREISTKAGLFLVHHITPSFFAGFGWREGAGGFLAAEPEKALVDCLYISSYKKKQFSHFPELHFPRSFSFKKAEEWIKKIKNPKAAAHARKRLQAIKRLSEIQRKEDSG